jgi:phosphopantetheinyl transferase (holo-ACP synthase)
MLPYVELTLVDLCLEVGADSNSHGTKLRKIVADELHKAIPSSQASVVAKAVFEGRRGVQGVINGKTSTDQSSKWIYETVLKYLKLSDQYLALASLLLKSKAFYLSLIPSLAHEDASDTSQHTMVELPRTEFGKPFIPPPCTYLEVDAHAFFPFSISHQYPFAGMARLVVGDAENEPNQQPSIQSLLVGLDIVVFEDYNPRLYDSTLEFVGVFQDSFTEWEWQQSIVRFESYGAGLLLKEFYLRWSIKEAYTKAIGLGMSIEFSSFETRLNDVTSPNQSLWSLIEDRGLEGLLLTGSIHSTKSHGESLGDWEFFFLPLYARDEPPKEPQACACVCVGPITRTVDRFAESTMLIKTQTTNLDDLLRWHHIPRRVG